MSGVFFFQVLYRGVLERERETPPKKPRTQRKKVDISSTHNTHNALNPSHPLATPQGLCLPASRPGGSFSAIFLGSSNPAWAISFFKRPGHRDATTQVVSDSPVTPWLRCPWAKGYLARSICVGMSVFEKAETKQNLIQTGWSPSVLEASPVIRMCLD